MDQIYARGIPAQGFSLQHPNYIWQTEAAGWTHPSMDCMSKICSGHVHTALQVGEQLICNASRPMLVSVHTVDQMSVVDLVLHYIETHVCSLSYQE